MRSSSWLCLLALAATGCAEAVGEATAGMPTPVGSVTPATEPRRVFESALTPVVTSKTAVRRVERSFARGRLRLKVWDDQTIEYWLSIYNPAGQTFASAQLRHAAQGDAAAVVVTLFSGASLRDKHIDVRGTASVVNGDTGAFLEALRSTPQAFVVSVQSASDARGTIRGEIH